MFPHPKLSAFCAAVSRLNCRIHLFPAENREEEWQQQPSQRQVKQKWIDLYFEHHAERRRRSALCTFSLAPFAQQQLLGAGGEKANSKARHGTTRGSPTAGPRTAERSQPQHMKTDTGFTIEESAARNRGQQRGPRGPTAADLPPPCPGARAEPLLLGANPPTLTAALGAAGRASTAWSGHRALPKARPRTKQAPGPLLTLPPSNHQAPIARTQRRCGLSTATGPSAAAPTGRDGPRIPAPALPCGPL